MFSFLILIDSGDLELRNLEFKENAFKEFKVPVLVKQGISIIIALVWQIVGCVGKLSLQIPWNNLTGEAIVVILEDVYVLVGPNHTVHVCDDPFCFLHFSMMKKLKKNTNDKRRKQDSSY